MTYIVLHNPSCSTSRKGLAALDEKGIRYDVRKYMNAGEALNEAELRAVAIQMGVSSPRAFLRDKDAQKFDLPEDATDDEVYEAMAGNPRLIQRPIGIHKGKAILGRPPENLITIT